MVAFNESTVKWFYQTVRTAITETYEFFLCIARLLSKIDNQ